MKQNINLLNDLPKLEKSHYPFSLLITLSCIFFVLLMVIYSISYFEYIHKSRIIRSLTIQQNIASKQLKALQNDILKEDKFYKDIANAQDKIYNSTQKLSNNGSQNLYAILETLGTQINPSVWLNQINIEKSGHHIDLAGFTIQPQNAMNFVTALNQTSLFAMTPFKLDNIKKISNKQYLYIQLATQEKVRNNYEH